MWPGLLALLRPLLKNKLTWIGVGVLAVGWLGYRGYQSWQHERQARVLAELERDGFKQLNDSTQAKLASTTPVLDSLQDQVAAAHALNGKLVAALRLRIPRRDTVVYHDTLPTVLSPDSTRTATFDDSTFAGRIQGTVVAPPCCAPLVLDSLRVTRYPFSPSIGFVQVGDRYVATVAWGGDSVEVGVPYFQPPHKPLGRFGPFVGAGYRWSTDLTPYGQLGGLVRPWRGAVLSGFLEGLTSPPTEAERWSLNVEFRQVF